MKRMYYISRFSRPLSAADLAAIGASAARNNPSRDITGFLVCLGDVFFQALEGPAEAVDRLYFDRILPDDRHKDVLCLKTDPGIAERLFPDWSMKVFDLNHDADSLPLAFREMLASLLESHRTLAQYTQPTVLKLLEQGTNPTAIRPRLAEVSVLFSDIIGFSRFAEHLAADDLISLVNSHAEVCAQGVTRADGEVNKLTGDGVLAYFPGPESDAAIEAARSILGEMASRRKAAPATSPHRYLYGGVGLAHGFVYEGNVGSEVKRDFTILGNTVNLAARIESLTRDLGVRLCIAQSVVLSATGNHPFRTLGSHRLKGQSKPIELFTLGSFSPLDVRTVYRSIESFVTRRP